MNTLSPFFLVIVYLIAYLTAYAVNFKYKINAASIRYEGIDSLRGFLALGVFIHHSVIWYQYIQTGKWDAPKSNLYTQLGQTSVSFFFMITSFLFITKLLNSTEKEFNWRAFFISRIFRLVPLYYFLLVLLVLYVMTNTHWQLTVSILSFLKSMFYWGIFSTADINNYNLTSFIISHATWTLPLEWLFYFSLPLISLIIFKKKTSLFYIVISILFICGYFSVNAFRYHNLLPFIGGAVAPFILKYGSRDIKVNNLFLGIIVLVCLFLITQIKTSNYIVCETLISIVFTSIALGNNLFGILKNSTLKFLGEICYSTYLLHGIVLFTVLYFGFGFEKVKYFTETEYCVLIFLTTPIIVIISFLGYKFIEKPFMDKAKKINDVIDSKYPLKTSNNESFVKFFGRIMKF